MLFNIMNEESVQLNYFLKPTDFSNFHLNSTIVYMSLNSSTDISCLKEKLFPKFPFKNHIPDEMLHFKWLTVVSDQIFTVNNKFLKEM